MIYVLLCCKRLTYNEIRCMSRWFRSCSIYMGGEGAISGAGGRYL